MTTFGKVMVGVVAALLLVGCANMKSSKAPGTDVAKLKSFYVQKLPADQRNVDKLISDRLNAMGYHSTFGPEGSAAGNVDATVSYQDRWMWDMTMYMLQLDIQVRDPQSQMILASATSYRPSLQRVSPDKMVEEVLNEIFKK